MTPRRDPTPLGTMAAVLLLTVADLADDRDCIVALFDAGYGARDILIGLDKARDRARAWRAAEADTLTPHVTVTFYEHPLP